MNGMRHRDVRRGAFQIPMGAVKLEVDLRLPEGAAGIIVFAHGSGSSRHSPRNCYVAQVLNHAGLATLLFDRLTSEEESEDRFTARLRFDIPLLADRLAGATAWLSGQAISCDLRVGYFGTSTGAAAQSPERIGAIVSRGGRPDLAGAALKAVRAPTLQIVGARDEQVEWLNRQAQAQPRTTTDLAIIPGASHIFEEPGALEQVAALAWKWFQHDLVREPDHVAPAGALI